MERAKLYKDREWLAGQYVIHGKSAREVASEIGSSEYTVRRWLRKHGIQVRSRSESIALSYKREHGHTGGKDAYYRQKYGISYKQFLFLYEFQRGRCAICGKRLPLKGHGVVVDHDHTSGRIRGLLCHQCNVGIGFLSDNYDVMLAAASYCKEGDRGQKVLDRFTPTENHGAAIIRMAVKRSGSVAVTIPAVFAAQLGITHGSILSFETNGRELIVRKVGEVDDEQERSDRNTVSSR